MPYLKIQTNRRLEAGESGSLLGEASREVARVLGKPETYVMVALEAGVDMSFAGDDAPLAYLELKSIGLPESRTPEISAALCALVEARLGVPGDRVYIEFSDVPRAMWGWRGATF